MLLQGLWLLRFIVSRGAIVVVHLRHRLCWVKMGDRYVPARAADPLSLEGIHVDHPDFAVVCDMPHRR